MRAQFRFGNRLKHKMLATADNRHREFVGFGCGQNKSSPRWWFFQRLQQGVERFPGKHVGFINNENLVSSLHGSISNSFPKAARIVNTPVGSAVYFHYIHMIALSDAATLLTLVAGFGYRSMLAIQGLGEDTGNSRFPHAARSAQQIRRSNAILHGCTGENCLDGILPGHFGKRLRAIAIRERCMAHGVTQIKAALGLVFTRMRAVPTGRH